MRRININDVNHTYPTQPAVENSLSITIALGSCRLGRSCKEDINLGEIEENSALRLSRLDKTITRSSSQRDDL